MTRFQWLPTDSPFIERPFRRVFERVKRPLPPEPEIVTAYTDGQVTLRSNRDKEGYHEAADLSGFQGVEVGDFVVHGLDILRGSVGVADSAGALSSVCTVCVPLGEADPRYFAYAMRAQAWSGVPRVLARGVREGGADFRRWNTLAELPLPVPSFSEQRLIADFLDFECMRLEALSSRLGSLCELLRERLRSNISERLSKIQVQSFVRIRHLATVNPPIPQWNMIPDETPLTFVPLESVWPRKVNFNQTRTKDQVSVGYTRFMEGDVIVPKITPTFEAGRCTWVSGSPTTVLVGTTELHVIRPSGELNPRFLEYLLSSVSSIQEGTSEMVGVAGQKRVPDEWIRNFRVPLIGLSEQEKIADDLDFETNHINDLVEKCERQSDLFSELKRALITAVVTGTTRVSKAASLGTLM